MTGVLAALATALGALATFGAWKAAARSSSAAETMLEIEQRRWHAHLTPRFEVTVTRTSDSRAMLTVALVGPPGLDHLERITVRVRDDGRAHLPRPGGPTAEELAAQVWGPYRFVPGVDGADADGRAIAPVRLQLGDARPFALEHTMPPPWSADTIESWRRQHDGQPIRLTLTCERHGDKPWLVPVEVVLPST